MALIGKKQLVKFTVQENPTEWIEFDASVDESHTAEVDVVDHPVEEGSDITDHIRAKPESLTAELIVSDDPIVILRSVSAKPAVSGGDPAFRASQAYDFLKTIKDGGKLLQVITTLRQYSNMVITSIAVPRNAQTGRVLRVSVTLREILIATTDTVDAPKTTKAPKKDQRKGKTDQGSKEKKEAKPQVERKASGTVNFVNNIFGSR